MSRAEKRAERIGLTELLRAIRAAQREVSTRVIKTVNSGSTSERFYGGQLNQIETLYRAIRSIWSTYIADEIPAQFSRYINVVSDQLKAAGKASLIAPRVHVVNQMVLDSVARMNLGTSNGLDNVKTLFRNTQQAITTDLEINRRLAEGMIESASPDNLKKVVKSQLYESLSGGNIIEINGRKYKADYYAELVARTRTREAQTQATINTILSFGEHLVRVSDHNTETKLCQEFEGHVYSLTGEGGYPLLGDYPPFHPNCLHVLTPYV